jgi:hypothetical protein
VTEHIRALPPIARGVAAQSERAAQRSAPGNLSRKGAPHRPAESDGPAGNASASARPTAGTHVSLGATRVGAMLARLGMHLGTARFLAELREDALWVAGCEDALLRVAGLESGMTLAALDASLHSNVATGRRARGWRAAPDCLFDWPPVAVGAFASRVAKGDRAPSTAARCAAANNAETFASLRKEARRCKRTLAAPLLIGSAALRRRGAVRMTKRVATRSSSAVTATGARRVLAAPSVRALAAPMKGRR